MIQWGRQSASANRATRTLLGPVVALKTLVLLLGSNAHNDPRDVAARVAKARRGLFHPRMTGATGGAHADKSNARVGHGSGGTER